MSACAYPVLTVYKMSSTYQVHYIIPQNKLKQQLESMTLSRNSPKRPKRDEVTKWHDSTNVVLDYCQAYLGYGSATDHVQCSS
jgi:hypothetical protein